MHPDTFHRIALARTPLLGPVNIRQLVAHCGGVNEVFHTSKKALTAIDGIGPTIAENILGGEGLRLAEREMQLIEQAEIEPIFFLDDEYPQRLLNIHSAPALLFFTGSDTRLLNHPRPVAIVGTRKPTNLGRQLTEQLVEGLKVHNCLIVSGLAFGIDITAHRAAVEKGLPTFGILGHGLGRIYPDDHRSTAKKMCENGGLLTEFPFEAGPDRMNFPMRNRIIAGLAEAVVVVETAAAGGSMITAALAFEYQRPVFTYPGRVRDTFSAGCNALIKTNRATLIESAKDLADMMIWEQAGGKKKGKQATLHFDLSPDERRVVDALRQNPHLTIDEMISSVQTEGDVVSVVSEMEMKGMVGRLPGQRFELV